MYVATFYSFKGGVGRTMALVNVAADLARRGRRVLAVDFDLEAPGLDTFDVTRRRRTPGIIDFVSAYLSSGVAPNVEEFVFHTSDVGTDKGDLWIMPAGMHDDNYDSRLAKIDWGALYEEHDGYLLFEDLKKQWSEFIRPDYVLVDSRTGHTDVGGICTRQLPDAVVLMFFPNVQNLRGLTKVVHDIRSERKRNSDESIDLHFVMSNIPDLDDEDKILDESFTSFQIDLGFRDDPLLIHRYDSLSLLNQVIFTKDRPRSRLAKEYRTITDEVMRLNPEDRDGALDYISHLRRVRRFPGITGVAASTTDARLEKIETKHTGDGEVLFRLGLLRDNEGNFDDAIGLFGRAIEAGYRQPELYLRRASIRRREYGDRVGASADALEVLESDDVAPGQVGRAVAMITPDQLKRVAHSASVASLPIGERIRIAAGLNRSRSEAEVARDLLRPLSSDTRLSTDELIQAKHELVLASIALGRFSEALEVINTEQADLNRMRILFAFNYGMALWGERAHPVRRPFDRVVEIERSDPREHPGANYLQCLAIALWAVGQAGEAQKSAESARREIRTRRRQEFSCWRYQRVSVVDFEQDLNEMLRLIGGDDHVTPRFMSSNAENPSFELHQAQLPVNWPTHLGPRELWEELGRTIASCGFLEDCLKRAYFALTATQEHDVIENVEDRLNDWATELGNSSSESMRQLTNRLAEALQNDSRFSKDEVNDITQPVQKVSRWRNVLCHGTWTNYDSVRGLAELRFLQRNGWREHFERSVSREHVASIRKEAVDAAIRIVDAVTSRGIQFPGSESPGREGFAPP